MEDEKTDSQLRAQDPFMKSFESRPGLGSATCPGQSTEVEAFMRFVNCTLGVGCSAGTSHAELQTDPNPVSHSAQPDAARRLLLSSCCLTSSHYHCPLTSSSFAAHSL